MAYTTAMYDRYYQGTIWTNHALTRLQERGISQGDAWVAFSKADQSRYAKTKDAWIYNKTLNGWKYEVVAKQNEKKEWVILSVWAKPAYESKKSPWLIRLIRQVVFGKY